MGPTAMNRRGYDIRQQPFVCEAVVHIILCQSLSFAFVALMIQIDKRLPI